MSKAIIFDTETTGLIEPELIEAAWIEVDHPSTLNIMQEFRQLYKPAKEIEPSAMAVHNIIDDDLKDCPPSNSFVFPDCKYLIGHNIDYDWSVVGEPNVKRICTKVLSCLFWPTFSHRQSAMLYALGDNQAETRELLKNAHSALIDVKNNLLLLGHIIKKAGNVTSWEDLYLLSEKGRIPTIMPFGKHKGAKIEDVPSDYISWLLKQNDIDPYLRKALESAH